MCVGEKRKVVLYFYQAGCFIIQLALCPLRWSTDHCDFLWGRLLFPRNLVTVTQALLQTFHLTPSSSLNWSSLKLIIDMNYDLSINGFTCWFVRPEPCVLTVEHALLMESNLNQKMVLLGSIMCCEKEINSQNI